MGIDFNRDARAHSAELQATAIQKLTEETSKYRKLHTDDEDDLVLPQIFIDGLYVGDGDDLQGLEDDGLLEALLKRERCPARVGKSGLCNGERSRNDLVCAKCGENFAELLP